MWSFYINSLSKQSLIIRGPKPSADGWGFPWNSHLLSPPFSFPLTKKEGYIEPLEPPFSAPQKFSSCTSKLPATTAHITLGVPSFLEM